MFVYNCKEHFATVGKNLGKKFAKHLKHMNCLKIDRKKTLNLHYTKCFKHFGF